MLIELTPEDIEFVTPVIPTWPQYSQYMGDFKLNVERFVVAIAAGVLFLLFSRLFNETGFGFILFLFGMLALLYPFLWGPLWNLSQRNLAFRNLPQSAFFFGRVIRVDVQEVILDEQEKLGADGLLYIEEIREEQFTVEIGDETGLRFTIRTPDEPRYRSIVPRQSVIAMVKAYSRDFRRPVLSEVYVVKLGQWVGDVSYLRRDEFLELANELVEMTG